MHSNSTTNFTSLDTLLLAGNFHSRWLLFFLDCQIIELLLALLVFVAIHSLRQRRHYGLPVWPVLGMLPSLVAAVQTNTYEWISDIVCRQNGTFWFKGPCFSSLNCVVTADPRNVEHLLKTKFNNFPKGPYFRDAVHDFLGDGIVRILYHRVFSIISVLASAYFFSGIFSADDEIWQKQRKTVSIEFHSAKFRRMTTESLNQLVHSRLLPILENAMKEALPIDLQDVLLRLTFDNVCIIAFGVDPCCLSFGLPKIPFAQAFEDATEATVQRFFTPTCVWKIMRYLNLGGEKNLKKCMKMVDEFADEVIRTRRKELIDEMDNSKNERSDILTVFMGLKDEQGKAYSDKFLRDVCVNLILAGRDTSSVTLSWFFWLLDKNPEVEQRIYSEIWRIVGEREDKMESKREMVLKAEEIKKMEYLQAALSEALRLYPAVPVDHKEVVEDDIFPDGTVLKKGTKVVYAIYAMGRMEAIWGKDCREFKPERWLKDGRFTTESAYKFTAFNGGPRLCLGKDFAYYQMKFAAASVIFRYRIKVVKNHEVVPKLALTLYMKHGLKVNLWKRNES